VAPQQGDAANHRHQQLPQGAAQGTDELAENAEDHVPGFVERQVHVVQEGGLVTELVEALCDVAPAPHHQTHPEQRVQGRVTVEGIRWHQQALEKRFQALGAVRARRRLIFPQLALALQVGFVLVKDQPAAAAGGVPGASRVLAFGALHDGDLPPKSARPVKIHLPCRGGGQGTAL
jgi:hypothetical protein